MCTLLWRPGPTWRSVRAHPWLGPTAPRQGLKQALRRVRTGHRHGVFSVRTAAHTALPVDAELIKRVPAAGTGGVRRQRLGGLDDALAISSADHNHMVAWSGAPCETPRAPDD